MSFFMNSCREVKILNFIAPCLTSCPGIMMEIESTPSRIRRFTDNGDSSVGLAAMEVRAVRAEKAYAELADNFGLLRRK